MGYAKFFETHCLNSSCISHIFSSKKKNKYDIWLYCFGSSVDCLKIICHNNKKKDYEIILFDLWSQHANVTELKKNYNTYNRLKSGPSSDSVQTQFFIVFSITWKKIIGQFRMNCLLNGCRYCYFACLLEIT